MVGDAIRGEFNAAGQKRKNASKWTAKKAEEDSKLKEKVATAASAGAGAGAGSKNSKKRNRKNVC